MRQLTLGWPASVGGDLLDAHSCRQGEVRYTRYTVTVVDYQRFTKSAPVTPRYTPLHPAYPLPRNPPHFVGSLALCTAYCGWGLRRTGKGGGRPLGRGFSGRWHRTGVMVRGHVGPV